MSSFNVYGQTEKVIGGNTPVWLGTVKPVPRGAKIEVKAGEIIKAGTPVAFDARYQTVNVYEELNGRQDAYIYNDVCNTSDSDMIATCAVVMHHSEGLLIERVWPDITDEQIIQLQSQIPGVLLVRG